MHRWSYCSSDSATSSAGDESIDRKSREELHRQMYMCQHVNNTFLAASRHWLPWMSNAMAECLTYCLLLV